MQGEGKAVDLPWLLTDLLTLTLALTSPSSSSAGCPALTTTVPCGRSVCRGSPAPLQVLQVDKGATGISLR